MIDVGETTVHLSLPDKKRRYSVVSNKSNSSVKSDFGNASGKQKAKKKQVSLTAQASTWLSTSILQQICTIT